MTPDRKLLDILARTTRDTLELANLMRTYGHTAGFAPLEKFHDSVIELLDGIDTAQRRILAEIPRPPTL